MKVQRVTRRSRSPIGPCGCLTGVIIVVVIIAIAAVLVLMRLPALALMAAGFNPQGSVPQVFNANNSQPVQLENPVSPSDAVLQLGQYGAQALPSSSVQTGNRNGASAALVQLSEADLLNVCRQRTTLCNNSNPQVQNVSVDLRPGGGIVYADVSLPEVGLSQRVGVVLRVDPTQRQFELAGVDVDGTLYTVPTGTLGTQAAEVVRTVNNLLLQASLQAGGGVYTLQSIQVDDAQITFLLG